MKPRSNAMYFTPLSRHIGADASDVDLGKISDSDFDQIYAAWLEHIVLRFRGQKLDDTSLQAFSSRFGPLEQAPFGRISEEERKRIRNRYVTSISNIIVDGKPIGGLGNAEAAWHSDMTYVENPPTASLLLSVEIPAIGGDTYFASQYAAYETLPGRLKDRVANLTLKHDATHNSVGELRRGYEEPASPIDSPGAVHPIVKIHPETKRKALYLGRRDWAYIPGLSIADSEALLDELWSFAAKPEFVWRQQWHIGDLVMWDNRAALHRRDDFDPTSRRLMRRCQVLAKTAA
jgi:taurine dioxygenase